MYKIDLKKEAKKDVRRLPPDEIPGIIKKLSLLKGEPRPIGCKKLIGSEDAYRIAKGDYIQ